MLTWTGKIQMPSMCLESRPRGVLPLANKVTGRVAEMAWHVSCGRFLSSLILDLIHSFPLDFQSLGKCNDLEALVNNERRNAGLRPLHCDANMRWVAYKHLDDADEGAKQNLAWGDECNLHSWLVKSPCCYTSDHENAECMWGKPYVSCIRPQMYSQTNGNIQELSGWDDRTGFEISAWFSNKMSATQAINQWKGSSGHYDMIMSRGKWSDLKTVGCGYRNNHAHCWFAKKRI